LRAIKLADGWKRWKAETSRRDRKNRHNDTTRNAGGFQPGRVGLYNRV
jgi:hypothetical protein